MKRTQSRLVWGALFSGALILGSTLSGCAETPPVAPKAAQIAPGAVRVELGAARVTTLRDGSAVRPLDASFVKNASLAEVQAALAEAGLPTDKVEIPFSPLLVELGGQRILFDAGNGEFGATTAGKLLAHMSQAGIDPQSITAVVISHFHGDHINGLRNKAGEWVFPNAKIFVPKAEWTWWMDDARMAAAPEAMKGTFAAARRVFGPIAERVVQFEAGAEILPGVHTLAAYGHTPGHTAFLIDGGSQKLLYWADTTNVAALFVRNPDWAVTFDMDAEAARKVRRALAEKVVREKLLLAGYHLPGAAIGTLAPRGNGYEFIPLSP